jgi:hypothetical protein
MHHSPATLDRTLQAWEQGGSGEMGGHVVDVVCATIGSSSVDFCLIRANEWTAFGMGIDKGDVRLVCQFGSGWPSLISQQVHHTL